MKTEIQQMGSVETLMMPTGKMGTEIEMENLLFVSTICNTVKINMVQKRKEQRPTCPHIVLGKAEQEVKYFVPVSSVQQRFLCKSSSAASSSLVNAVCCRFPLSYRYLSAPRGGSLHRPV